MNFLGMGPGELLLVLVLALVVFGPDKMPEIARQIGKTVGELRRVSSEVTREIQRSIQEEPPGPGPRIVHQNPPASPPSPEPVSYTPPAPALEEPRILPPSNGGEPSSASANGAASQSSPTPAQKSATEGSWEEGRPAPALPETEHGRKPSA